MLRKLNGGGRPRLVVPAGCIAFAVLVTGGAFVQSAGAQCIPGDPGCHLGEFKEYFVEKVSGTAPVANGQVDPGEWDEANGYGGGWHLLRTGTTPETATPDSGNWRFKALWDDDFLYLLVQGDKPAAGWPAAGFDELPLDWGKANINIYVDPNTDGELQQRVDGDIDNYHLAYNIREGYGHSVNASETLGGAPVGGGAVFPDNFSQFEGVADNTPFENNGWKLSDEPTFTHQVTTNGGATEGVFEMAWPWEGFNAETTNDPGNGGLGGLPHAFAPVLGEEWLFNIYTNTGDSGGNWLPIWNWNDTQSATYQPPGLFTFVDGGIPGLPGDGNGDGWVDGLDYLLWASNFGEDPSDPSGAAGGDYNDDGKTDGLDYLLWAGNFGTHAEGAAVPEPGTLALACLALASIVVSRRRRS